MKRSWKGFSCSVFPLLLPLNSPTWYSEPRHSHYVNWGHIRYSVSPLPSWQKRQGNAFIFFGFGKIPPASEGDVSEEFGEEVNCRRKLCPNGADAPVSRFTESRWEDETECGVRELPEFKGEYETLLYTGSFFFPPYNSCFYFLRSFHFIFFSWNCEILSQSVWTNHDTPLGSVQIKCHSWPTMPEMCQTANLMCCRQISQEGD